MNMNDHRRLEAIGHVSVLSTEYALRRGYGRRCCATVPPAPATLVGWAATMAVLDERGATQGEEATPYLPIAPDTMGARKAIYDRSDEPARRTRRGTNGR